MAGIRDGLEVEAKTNQQLAKELANKQQAILSPLQQRLQSMIAYFEDQASCAQYTAEHLRGSIHSDIYNAITRINNIHIKAHCARHSYDIGYQGSNLPLVEISDGEFAYGLPEDIPPIALIGYPNFLESFNVKSFMIELDAKIVQISKDYEKNLGGAEAIQEALIEPIRKIQKNIKSKVILEEEYTLYERTNRDLLTQATRISGDVDHQNVRITAKIESDPAGNYDSIIRDLQDFQKSTLSTIEEMEKLRASSLKRIKDVYEASSFTVDKKKISKLTPKIQDLLLDEIGDAPEILSYSEMLRLRDLRIPSRNGEKTEGGIAPIYERYNIGHVDVVDNITILGKKIDIYNREESNWLSRSSGYASDNRRTSSRNGSLILDFEIWERRLGKEYRQGNLGRLKNFIKIFEEYGIPVTRLGTYKVMLHGFSISDLGVNNSNQKTYIIPSQSPDILTPIRNREILPEFFENGLKPRGVGDDFNHFIVLSPEVEERFILGTGTDKKKKHIRLEDLQNPDFDPNNANEAGRPNLIFRLFGRGGRGQNS